MKLTYFLFWLATVDISILLVYACHYLLRIGFRLSDSEDEQDWEYLVSPTGQNLVNPT
jgi:hypothetical protein